MFSDMVTIFQSGGIFMYPILFVFAFGVAIAIERYIYLSALKFNNRRLLGKVMPLLKQGSYQEAYQITSRSSNVAICQMLNLGLATMQSSSRREDIEMAMEEELMEIMPRLEKRTHYLAMLANISTLLGLLGTIQGLIQAFNSVAQVDPSLKAEILSSSISVAMNTTAFGLLAAIPLIIIFSILQAKTTEIVDSLEMATVKFVNILAKRKTQA